jgi:putative ABC transport system permease protein
MQVHLVLIALRKHRIATFLIALQISLACAVLCNACFLIVQRAHDMRINSGVNESDLGLIKLSGVNASRAVDLNARVIDSIRHVAGVKDAGVVSSVPFGDSAIRAGVFLDDARQSSVGVVDFYLGDTHATGALGMRLVAGRLPSADEYTPVAQFVPLNAPVLITRVLAEHFWPGQNPIGKQFWAIDTQFRVIGVVDHLSVSQPGGGEAKDPDWSVFVPALAGPNLVGHYLVRAEHGDLDRVMLRTRDAVIQAAPDAVLDMESTASLPELRHRYFESSRVMIALLVAVIVALLGTTALGIVGLASFWVAQRRKQVGTRRALGATRTDILRYFQIENFIIVTVGIVIGTGLTYVLNFELMRVYEVPRIPGLYVPVGAVALWILGQLAVLLPALRAASISPMEAIRTA